MALFGFSPVQGPNNAPGTRLCYDIGTDIGDGQGAVYGEPRTIGLRAPFTKRVAVPNALPSYTNYGSNTNAAGIFNTTYRPNKYCYIRVRGAGNVALSATNNYFVNGGSWATTPTTPQVLAAGDHIVLTEADGWISMPIERLNTLFAVSDTTTAFLAVYAA